MPKSFGEKIRERRIELRLTLEQLAVLIGSTKNYVWELEQKKQKNARPSAKLVINLARALGLSPEYLADDAIINPSDVETDEVLIDQYKSLSDENQIIVQKLIAALAGDASGARNSTADSTNEPRIGDSEDTGPDLSTFISLARRENNLNSEELAAELRIDVDELTKIESDPMYLPKPRTINKLAEYLNVPEAALATIAGTIKSHESDTKTPNGNKYAAQSDELSSLNRKERKLLAEYVQYLNEITGN